VADSTNYRIKWSCQRPELVLLSGSNNLARGERMMLAMTSITLEYHADLVVATLIWVGYLLTIIGMWWVRKSFTTIASMGFLMFPILVLWSVFYFFILHTGGMGGPWTEWFVWASRLGHFLQITMLFIVIIVGKNIATAKRTERDGD
jgi:hypothetical protein